MTNCNEIPQTAYERVYGSGINSEEKYDVRLERLSIFLDQKIRANWQWKNAPNLSRQ